MVLISIEISSRIEGASEDGGRNSIRRRCSVQQEQSTDLHYARHIALRQQRSERIERDH